MLLRGSFDLVRKPLGLLGWAFEALGKRQGFETVESGNTMLGHTRGLQHIGYGMSLEATAFGSGCAGATLAMEPLIPSTKTRCGKWLRIDDGFTPRQLVCHHHAAQAAQGQANVLMAKCVDHAR